MPIRTERRLAAIMVADIVGYSRLMEADEAGTLATIKSLRSKIIDPLLAEYKGRIVKVMGDGVTGGHSSVNARGRARTEAGQSLGRTCFSTRNLDRLRC